MNRISRQFELLKRERRKGFIPFVTAGDPDVNTTKKIILCLSALGADVIELGVPFSDPMADGPTIQASSQRALSNGVNLKDVLDLIADIRALNDIPIVLFSYLNPLIRFGLQNVAKQARAAGVDGVLITDVVDREADIIRDILGSDEIDLISLVAPTTSEERLKRITQNARGFLYAVSHAGVTGASVNLNSEARYLAQRARRFTDLPIAVGFGISTAAQVADVWQFADAAVVGSAIVDAITAARRGEEVSAVESFVSSLIPSFANSDMRP